MPNWNDPASIKKWLDKQPKTVRTERRRPTEDREERARAEAPDRVPHWEQPSAPREEPRPTSTYKPPPPPPPQHSEKYNQAWRRKSDLPNPQGGYATGMEEITPYTNYQALPEFVTSQRRNPVGGRAGVEEMPGMLRYQAEYGTYTPPLSGQALDNSINFSLGVAGGNPDALANYLDAMAEDGQTAGNFFIGGGPPPVTNFDWGSGPSAALLKYQSPAWRKSNDFWHRVQAADIVPAGQTVPLGKTMHPNYGPGPESTYFSDWTPETIMAAIADGYNKRR